MSGDLQQYDFNGMYILRGKEERQTGILYRLPNGVFYGEIRDFKAEGGSHAKRVLGRQSPGDRSLAFLKFPEDTHISPIVWHAQQVVHRQRGRLLEGTYQGAWGSPPQGIMRCVKVINRLMEGSNPIGEGEARDIDLYELEQTLSPAHMVAYMDLCAIPAGQIGQFTITAK